MNPFLYFVGLTVQDKQTALYMRSSCPHLLRFAWRCGLTTAAAAISMVKGKVFPYSLPSVGPGADPGVQAVSPQVT